MWEQAFMILVCISLFNHISFAKGTEDGFDKTCDYQHYRSSYKKHFKFYTFEKQNIRTKVDRI